jgi:hypothetical protein
MTVEENSGKFGVNKFTMIEMTTAWRHPMPRCGRTGVHDKLRADEGDVLRGASVDFAGVWHFGEGPLRGRGRPLRRWRQYCCLEPNL